jgi:hypothetical protein
MSNFVEDILSGKTKIESIDDYVEEWHLSDSTKTIYEYLGLTWEEYGRWIVNPSSLKITLDKYL